MPLICELRICTDDAHWLAPNTLHEGGMDTCPRALSCVNVNYEWIISWGGDQFRTGTPKYQTNRSPPTAVTSVLSIRSWPIRQTWVGTSWMVSHTRSQQRDNSTRNDSQAAFLGCLLLAQLRRYYFVRTRIMFYVNICHLHRLGRYPTRSCHFVSCIDNMNKYGAGSWTNIPG